MTTINEAAKDLPKDPGHALATFAERVYAVYETERHSFSIEDSIFIISFIERFSTKFCIKVTLDEKPNESRPDYALRLIRFLDRDFKHNLLSNVISREVDDVINDFLEQQDDTFGLARLNEDEKAKIHVQITLIREVIGASVLSDRKKNALYERLDRLASEVDAHGTRTERFFAFMGDVAFVAGDMAEKAKPLLDEVKQMMRILARSRARQEGVSLPPGDDVVLLPPPSDGI